jgi:hypothetical protein
MPRRVINNLSNANQALNYLLELQEFSLANYAAQAGLYANGDRANCLAMIRDIARDQQMRATDVGQLLVNRRAHSNRAGFSVSLTGLNDLCASYVAGRLLREQPALIEAIVETARHLEDDPEAKAIAERILTAERHNLQQLRRLLNDTTREEVIAMRPQNSNCEANWNTPHQESFLVMPLKA